MAATSKTRRGRKATATPRSKATSAPVAPSLAPAVTPTKRHWHFQWPWHWQLQPIEPKRSFPKLPSVWKLSLQTARTLWEYKLPLGGIVAVYAALNLLLVQSFASPTQAADLKTHLGQLFHGHLSQFFASTSAFTKLIGSTSTNSSQSGGVYQFFLLIFSSLAVIWALRQLQAGVLPRIRDTYYRGLYPVVPFILVLLVIGLDLVPLMLASAMYGIVVSNGIAVFWYEQVLWGLLTLLFMAASLFLVVSAIFALYVVTLPDMTPMAALRSARPLVRGRRWPIIRKVLFLPIAILVVGFVIMIPFAVLFAPVARVVLFLLAAIAIAAVHTYMYSLYRELLREQD